MGRWAFAHGAVGDDFLCEKNESGGKRNGQRREKLESTARCLPKDCDVSKEFVLIAR